MPSSPRRRGAFLVKAALRAAVFGATGLSGLSALSGCASPPPPPAPEAKIQPLPAGSFTVAWVSDVDAAQNGEPDRVFLRDDLVFVYTKTKVVYALSTSGETRFFSSDVVGANDKLWPPVVVEANNRLGANIGRVLVFPSNTTYVLLTEEGSRVQSVNVSQGGYTQAITSPTYAADGLCYVGLADNYGGRIVAVDPTKEIAPVLRPALVGGAITARPAFLQGTVYAGDSTGTVTAITSNRRLAWNQPFQTQGPIRADLTIDEFGLYVAGTDGSLYCVDRNTGRLKWQYYAQTPLSRPAVAGERDVYLAVPGKGVVALSKTEGDTVSREPLWTVAGAQDVLSQDAQNVYLIGRDGHLLAIDKRSGEEKFRSEQSDLTLFAQNDAGPRIFAADAAGRVVAIDPVLGRGRVGQLADAR